MGAGAYDTLPTMRGVSTLRARPWYPQVNAIFAGKGIHTFAWEHNCMRESGGNPRCLGDHGKSRGLFQIYEHGLGAGVIAEVGHAKAVLRFYDPVESAKLIGREAVEQKVNAYPTDLEQCFAFCCLVERPIIEVRVKLRKELEAIRPLTLPLHFGE